MLIRYHSPLAMPPNQRGFSMIEILIALFILAVGVLGFAGLQMMSLSSSQEGYLRSQATQLAENLAARMRSNRIFINGNDVANPYITNSVGAPFAGYTRYCSIGAVALNPAPPPVDCNVNVCTASDVAAFDRTAICAELAAMQIPEGEIGIRCADRDLAAGVPDADACSGYSRYTIYVGWQPNLKTDKGEIIQNVAGACANEMGLTGTKSCIAVEVIP